MLVSDNLSRPTWTIPNQKWLKIVRTYLSLKPIQNNCNYTHCSDITFCENIPLINERIIIPTTLRAEMKSIILQEHLGIESCKKRARQSLFWPLINSEIENMIKKCPTCLTFWSRQPSEPIINHLILNQTWTKTVVDAFLLYGYYYLLNIDYYSKFIVTQKPRIDYQP